MTPLFCEDLIISASSPVRALDKLAANGITAYSARRIAPGKLKIRVKCKETAKIFAIFRGSCYTVTKAGPARLAKLRARALRRPGILAGLAAFVLAAYCVNIPVLRIDVTGSARYEEEAYAVLAESGVRTFALCGEEEREAARRALLALPGVVFASVEKEGCVVTAVIEESEETPLPERERDLVCPRAGVLEELAVLRGTALVSEGDAVGAGQTLVAGYFLTEEGERRETFAVARASILCTFSAEYFSAERSDAAAADAVAAAHLAAGGELVSSEVSVRAEGDGYIYGAAVTVRLRISVNLD